MSAIGVFEMSISLISLAVYLVVALMAFHLEANSMNGF